MEWLLVPDGLIWVFQKLMIYWDFHCTTISRVYREWSEKEKIFSERQLCERKCLVDVRGQRRMGRLVRDDREATVTQITTRYNQGMQNTSLNTQHLKHWSRWSTAAEDHTGCRSCQLRTGNGGYNSHRLTKIVSRNREESRFLLQHSDVRVRIWRKEHESMDPSCLVSTVQAGGGVMVWGIFSWHTLGPLEQIEHRLNTTAYLSIVADHVHPFMTTVYPSSDGYFQQDNVTKLKSSQKGFLNMTMSSLYSNGLHSHQISIQ